MSKMLKTLTSSNAKLAKAVDAYIAHTNKGIALLEAVSTLLGENTNNILALSIQPEETVATAPAPRASRSRREEPAEVAPAPKARARKSEPEEEEVMAYEEEDSADEAAERVRKARRSHREEYNEFAEKVADYIGEGSDYYIDFAPETKTFLLRIAAPKPRRNAKAATPRIEEVPTGRRARRDDDEAPAVAPAPKSRRRAEEDDDLPQVAPAPKARKAAVNLDTDTREGRVNSAKASDPDGYDAFFDAHFEELDSAEIDFIKGKWVLVDEDGNVIRGGKAAPAPVAARPAPRAVAAPVAAPRGRRPVDEDEIPAVVEPVRVSIPSDVPKSQHKAYTQLASKYAAEIADGTHVVRYNADEDRVYVAKRRAQAVVEEPAPRAAAARTVARPAVRAVRSSRD